MPQTFDEDDQVYTPGSAIADVTGTAAATYGGTEQAILNNTKTAVNAILAALRDANIIPQD